MYVFPEPTYIGNLRLIELYYVRFYVQNRRPVNYVNVLQVEDTFLDFLQPHGRNTNGVWPRWAPGSKDTMEFIVHIGFYLQVTLPCQVKMVNQYNMGETAQVFQTGPVIRENFNPSLYPFGGRRLNWRTFW